MTKDPDRHARDALISEHLPFARRLARAVLMKLKTSVHVDDVMSSATIGLVEAAQNFDPARGVPFQSFASRRICGAILDDLRAGDSLSRDMRTTHKALTDAAQKFTLRMERYPDEQELAVEMGVSLERLRVMQRNAIAGSVVMGYDDFQAGGDSKSILDVIADPLADDALDILLNREATRRLEAQIRRLPMRTAAVISLYFAEDLNLKQVARVMGFTESRACQVLAEGVKLMRENMQDGEA